ncbi:MAG: hypothetical protein AB7U76_24380 [Pirellulales bacterium]
MAVRYNPRNYVVEIHLPLLGLDQGDVRGAVLVVEQLLDAADHLGGLAALQDVATHCFFAEASWVVFAKDYGPEEPCATRAIGRMRAEYEAGNFKGEIRCWHEGRCIVSYDWRD